MTIDCATLGLKLMIPSEYVAFCTHTYVENPQECIYYVERKTWDNASDEDIISPSYLKINYEEGSIKLPKTRITFNVVGGFKKKDLVEIIRVS